MDEHPVAGYPSARLSVLSNDSPPDAAKSAPPAGRVHESGVTGPASIPGTDEYALVTDGPFAVALASRIPLRCVELRQIVAG
ncbi:hypothetical protein GCM10027068_47500 [Prescottella soli]